MKNIGLVCWFAGEYLLRIASKENCKDSLFHGL